MTRDQQIADIRAACIKANPEIVELKYGCRIEYAEIEWLIVQGIGKCTKHKLYRNCNESCDFEDAYELVREEGVFTEPESIILERKLIEPRHIVGRSIRLSDLLIAMTETMTRPGDWIVDAGGQFWEIEAITDDGGWGTKPHKVRWNLKRDDLSEQSDECIAFLTGIFQSR